MPYDAVSLASFFKTLILIDNRLAFVLYAKRVQFTSTYVLLQFQAEIIIQKYFLKISINTYQNMSIYTKFVA